MRFDMSILERYRMEPRTDREERGLERLDPTAFSVWSTKLQLICEEGKDVLVRTGVSEATQAGDCIAGVYTASGDLAVASVGTCVHATTGQIPLKLINKYYLDDPTVGVADGDMFFFNEAIYGGIHNPDQFTALPIVVDDTLVAWVVAGGHVSETGATEPGGMVVDARSRYDEGLKAPPVKVAQNFAFKRDVMDLLNNLVRDERLMEGEMMARAAACLKIRERILEVIRAQDADVLAGLLRRCCEATAEGSRQAISQMLDGTFRQVMFLDSTGTQEGLIRIMVTVRKEGDRLIVDLGGCSPQLPSGSNCFPHVVRAMVSGALCMYVLPDLPVSSGVYQPVEFAPTPVGTVVNPTPEVGTSLGIRSAVIAAQAAHGCLNKAMFGSAALRERVALPFGSGGRCFVGGGPNQYGRVVAGIQCVGVMNGTGGGARPDADGVDSAGFYFAGYGDALDIEHAEIQLPNLYAFRMLAEDVAGAGRFRGGAPLAEAILFHRTAAFYSVPMMGTTRFPVSLGQFGGYAAGCLPAVTMRGTNWQEALRDPGLQTPRTLRELWENRPVSGEYTLAGLSPGTLYHEGDGVALAGEGGGGWGDALDRDPASVADDVGHGVYSRWTAENVFKVIVDPVTGEVDEDKTAEARAEERRARLERGRPYAEFVAEWETLSPPAELLTFYGSWPYAEVS